MWMVQVHSGLNHLRRYSWCESNSRLLVFSPPWKLKSGDTTGVGRAGGGVDCHTIAAITWVYSPFTSKLKEILRVMIAPTKIQVAGPRWMWYNAFGRCPRPSGARPGARTGVDLLDQPDLFRQKRELIFNLSGKKIALAFCCEDTQRWEENGVRLKEKGEKEKGNLRWAQSEDELLSYQATVKPTAVMFWLLLGGKQRHKNVVPFSRITEGLTSAFS